MKSLNLTINFDDTKIEVSGIKKELKQVTIGGNKIGEKGNIFLFDDFVYLNLLKVGNMADKIVLNDGEKSIEIEKPELIFINDNVSPDKIVEITTNLNSKIFLFSQRGYERFISSASETLPEDKYFLIFGGYIRRDSQVIDIEDPDVFLNDIFNLMKEILVDNYITKSNELEKLLYDYMTYIPDKVESEREIDILIFFLQHIMKKYTEIKSKKDMKRWILNGKVYKIFEKRELIILGDIHGDLKSMADIFYYENIFKKLVLKDNFALIFLGDYIDRGVKDINVLRTVLLLQLLFPGKVFLLRGNHETFFWDENNKKLLSTEKKSNKKTFVGRWLNELNVKKREKYGKTFIEFFENYMPIILFYEPLKLIMLHGGVPPFENEGEDIFPYFEKIEELSNVIKKNGVIKYKPENIIWSRIDRNEGKSKKFHNIQDYEYGEIQVEKFLKKVKAKRLIRGHDPLKEGIKFHYGGKLITLHSTGGIGNPHSSFATIYTPAYIYIDDNQKMYYKRLVSPNFFLYPDKESFVIWGEIPSTPMEDLTSSVNTPDKEYSKVSRDNDNLINKE